eukprot:3120485-Rhodomonas_salina.1
MRARLDHHLVETDQLASDVELPDLHSRVSRAARQNAPLPRHCHASHGLAVCTDRVHGDHLLLPVQDCSRIYGPACTSEAHNHPVGAHRPRIAARPIPLSFGLRRFLFVCRGSFQRARQHRCSGSWRNCTRRVQLVLEDLCKAREAPPSHLSLSADREQQPLATLVQALLAPAQQAACRTFHVVARSAALTRNSLRLLISQQHVAHNNTRTMCSPTPDPVSRNAVPHHHPAIFQPDRVDHAGPA